MKSPQKRVATAAAITGAVFVVLGFCAGLTSQFLALPAASAVTMRVAGLSAVMVGALVWGLGVLASRAAHLRQRRTPRSWKFAPVIGFALGALFGNAFFGQTLPFGAIGVVGGLALWWSGWRRRSAAYQYVQRATRHRE